MLNHRVCGTLLHPTSLPGPHGSGDLGADAYHFVDWLEAAGQRVWQILPLTEIGRGNSPYMSPSAFAGNRLLIDLRELARLGWLDRDDIEAMPGADPRRIDFAATIAFRDARLARAARRFARNASPAQRQDYAGFCESQADWLDDYALFAALSERFRDRDWCDWDESLALREPAALAHAAVELAEDIERIRFAQWNFLRQWQRLRDYADARGIAILGDAPIFVAYHSADVWARRELFDLEASGRPRVVAGVPPDYFSASGQLWGNPLYRWDVHREEDYAWWIERLRRSFELYDALRLDHFLGFVNFWEVAADAETAIEGRWLPGPGAALFERAETALGRLAIVAENLGSVTNEVEVLRKRLGFPGMVVLQFAWSSDNDNPHLPHNHETDSMVYTGTHDNDTALGWWASLDAAERDFVRDYLQSDMAEPNRELIRCALASRANTAVVPLQDYLGLGSEHRMNTPGNESGNWRWRFAWSDLPDSLAPEIADRCARHRRTARRGTGSNDADALPS